MCWNGDHRLGYSDGKIDFAEGDIRAKQSLEITIINEEEGY